MSNSIDDVMLQIEEAVRVSIDNVTNKIIDTLKEFIDSEGIGNGYNNKIYEPTGEFREAWSQDLATKVGDMVEGRMFYDPSDMEFDPPVHGTYGYDGREGLDDIIFDGLSGDIFGDGFWRNKRDAWSEMVSYVDSQIDSWFDQEMTKQGFGTYSNVTFM